MVKATFFRAGCLVALVASAACAHTQFKAPDDPVEEARLRLSEITGAAGDAACAANEVDGARALAALQALGPEEPAAGHRTDYWRQRQAGELNLSQASAAASGAWERQKSQEEAARAGVAGARLQSYRAMQDFDALMSAAGNTSTTRVRRVGAGPAETGLMASQYAAVWSEFFATTDAEARNQLLDWLTTRSLDHPDILRAYHEDFVQALRHACG